MRITKGFTLIELMVTLVVLAIILSMALPSFAEMLRSNRADSQRALLISSLNLARSEAIRRSVQVGVSRVTNTSWTGGWRVWIDANNNNTYDSSEIVIKEFPALTGDATLASSVSAFAFTSQGYLSGGSPGSSTTLEFRVGTSYCRLERDIKVNHLGRVSLERRTCS